MKKNIVTPLLGQVLQEIAPRIGATVLLEPEWGIVGQITFRNGRKRYFRYSSIDLNSSRDTRIRMNDPRIGEKLRHHGLTLRSIPANGERIFLLDNANLSTGGDSVDVTEYVHPEFRKIAARLTRDMGLRLCGVDLIVPGDIREKPAAYWVLEINAAPGLDHYARSGAAQEKIVENLYLKVLKSMAR